MPLLFEAYIAFDDDTPEDHPPFTHEQSVWSMAYDYGLNASGERGFYAALGFDPKKEYPAPLHPLRGVPEFIRRSSPIRQHLELEDDYAGWLDGREFFAALRHARIDEIQLGRPVRVFLGAVRYLVSIYGERRVRVVFTFVT